MKTLLSAIVMATVFLAATPALARPAEEEARITYLLETIGGMGGASFIRGGKSYSSQEAEAHLRMKLEKAGKKVQTAEQFVTGVASKSYLTGKPYQIRFKDGKVVEAGPFLSVKLAQFKAKR